ncbi:hypothetical protein GW17_00019393 [Ensete ventricosum]|nr:hypothetical protein GW17_00019393 [Ensete ventricosum]
MVLRVRTAREGFGVQDGSFIMVLARVPARGIGLVFTGTVGWDQTEDVETIEGVMREVCSLEVFGDALIRNSIFISFWFPPCFDDLHLQIRWPHSSRLYPVARCPVEDCRFSNPPLLVFL